MSRAVVLGLFVVLASCKDDAPPAPASTTAGTVIEVTGNVTAAHTAATPVALHVGDAVGETDVIDTGADGRVAIQLVHNQARWELGPNKHQKVSESIAWSLPKQDGTTKPVEQDTSSAGRNAERSAADSSATTTPSTGAAGAPPPTEAKQLEQAPKAGHAAATKGAPPPPAPPPPPPEKPEAAAVAPPDVQPVAPGAIESPKADAQRTTRGGSTRQKDAPPSKGVHDILVDASDALARCLSRGSKVTLAVTVSASGSASIKLDAPTSAEARSCLDREIKKLKFPAAAGTAKIELER